MSYTLHEEIITDTSTGKSIAVVVLETSVQPFYLEHVSWLEYGQMVEGQFSMLGPIVGDFHRYVKVDGFVKGTLFTPSYQQEYRIYIFPLFPFTIVRAEKREGLEGKATRTIIYTEENVFMNKTWDD